MQNEKNNDSLMTNDTICKNRSSQNCLHIPKSLCVFNDENKIQDVFSCEEYCGMMKYNCDNCGIQNAFDRLAKYESTDKHRTKQFHEKQVQFLFDEIGQCDVILKQIDSIINSFASL